MIRIIILTLCIVWIVQTAVFAENMPNFNNPDEILQKVEFFILEAEKKGNTAQDVIKFFLSKGDINMAMAARTVLLIRETKGFKNSSPYLHLEFFQWLACKNKTSTLNALTQVQNMVEKKQFVELQKLEEMFREDLLKCSCVPSHLKSFLVCPQ